MKSRQRCYLAAVCCLPLLGACTPAASPSNPSGSGKGGGNAGNGGSPAGSGGSTAGSGGAGGGVTATGGGGGGQATAGSGGAGSGGSPAAPADAGTDSTGGDGSSDAPSAGKPGYLTCNYGVEGNGIKENVPAMTPPEWTLKAGVTPGTITAMANFSSTVFNGYNFPYRIYTSANYVKGQPALFLVFGDGGMYLGGGYKTPTVLDNLTAAGDIPPVVGLFVDPGPMRVQIYDPPTDKYARFLTEELIPKVIEPNYSISPDPNAWATVGYSASGEAGFAVVWHRPEKFHNFFGHSCSFGASIDYDGWVWADKIAMAPKRDLRVSLSVGSQMELDDRRGNWIVINRAVNAALVAKGNATRLIVGPGTHDGRGSQQDFPIALRWMWRGCKFTPNP